MMGLQSLREGATQMEGCLVAFLSPSLSPTGYPSAGPPCWGGSSFCSENLRR